jgi:hypothetical protein
MLPMYPAYGSSAESEGDGQPPSDSERRRWYAGCPNLFLELSRCAPVTGAGQTAHDFNFPIHYRRSQNRDGINRVLDRLISICYKPVTLNSLPVHPFCRVPGVTYSDATSVLYTARLVRRALRMQPTVR